MFCHVLIICFSFLFDWSCILMLGVLVGLIWRHEKVWMVEHMASEVTDEVYQLATSRHNWRRTRWKALVQADLVGRR